MKKLFAKLVASFDMTHNGFSGRKISACIAVIVAVHLSEKFASATNVEYIINSWMLFALLCLGIVTVEQILRFKSGKEIDKNEPSPKPTETP